VESLRRRGVAPQSQLTNIFAALERQNQQSETDPGHASKSFKLSAT
jgi:hypothetical protein